MTANRADDPFDGLPLLIPVSQAAKLLGISERTLRNKLNGKNARQN